MHYFMFHLLETSNKNARAIKDYNKIKAFSESLFLFSRLARKENTFFILPPLMYNDFFFIRRKNDIPLLRYEDFYIFYEATNFKVYDIIISITAKSNFQRFFRILRRIKIKFG